MTAVADIEKLKEAFAEFHKGEFQKAVSILHEEFEWVDAPEPPGATTWRGHDGVLACWSSWTGAWGEVATEPIEYVDAGAGVYFVPLRMRAAGAASGTPIEMTVWYVWSFRDGKPQRVTVHVDEDSARRAAGLAP